MGVLMIHSKIITISALSLMCAFQLNATQLSCDQLRTGLSKNEFSTTLSTLHADKSDDDELWYWLDLARLQQANGDFNTSIHSFEKAYALLDEYENRAKVSLRNIGSFLGSALLSKGAESYYGKGYERTLMHTLNALNYTMLGDFGAAAVEMRRMEQRQEFWLKETEEKIKDAAEEKAKAAKDGTNIEALPEGYSMASMLQDDDVRNLANSYQDPFSYTLSSIISTLATNGETNGDAEISIKRAMSLNPDVSKAFIAHVEPVKVEVKAPKILPAKGKKNKKVVEIPSKPQADVTMEVTVVVLSGQAPSLKIDKIRFPIFQGASYTSIDLPAFNPPINDISMLTIRTEALNMQPPRLLKSNTMAYKTLKDELPGDLAKAVVRATAKAIAAKQMSDNFGFFAGLATSLVMDAGSSLCDSGYRNWEVLPNSGYLAKFKAKRGETFTMILNDRQESFTLPTDKKGTLVLVSYITPDNVRIDNVTY